VAIRNRHLRVLASLKLAVFVIIGMAVTSAVGTFVEAKYNDAEMANKLVYQSRYMYVVMGLLIVNLIAVMVDRWPWKRHHLGFVLAHCGIIILLFGAWLTQQFGVDGSMAFAIGESRRAVSVRERDLLVYASLDGSTMRSIFEQPVDFVLRPPSVEKPFVVQLGADQIRVIEALHYAYRESEIVAGLAGQDGPALRIQLENPNVNMTEWVRRERWQDRAELELGPARVIVAKQAQQPSGRNEILFWPVVGSTTQLHYAIYSKDKSLKKQGRIVESDTLETGWMGLKLRLLRYIPSSRELVRYQAAPASSPMTTAAVKFQFGDGEYWMGLNTPLRLYQDDRAYIVIYGNRQIDLGFSLLLKKFTMGTYEGTSRAASYESLVDVPGRGEVLISMNEPLKHAGYTFYQSSFQNDEKGVPVVSVLSVNHDPGRWPKYLGSLLIVLGSVLLFYFRRAKWLNGRNATPGRAV